MATAVVGMYYEYGRVILSSLLTAYNYLLAGLCIMANRLAESIRFRILVSRSQAGRSEPARRALILRASFKMHIYRLLLLIFYLSSHPPPTTISFLRFSLSFSFAAFQIFFLLSHNHFNFYTTYFFLFFLFLLVPSSFFSPNISKPIYTLTPLRTSP